MIASFRYSSLLVLCESCRGKLATELGAGVVQRLVERAASRRKPIGEHVDRHFVQRQRDEHLALMRGQRTGDRVAQRLEELGALELLLGGGTLVGECRPALGGEHALAALPGATAEPDTRLEQRELVGPRREAARATKVVEL